MRLSGMRKSGLMPMFVILWLACSLAQAATYAYRNQAFPVTT